MRPHCCFMRSIALGSTFLKLGGILHWAERCYQGAASVRIPTVYTDPDLMAISRAMLWREREGGKAEGGQHQSEEAYMWKGNSPLLPGIAFFWTSAGELLLQSPFKARNQVTTLSWLIAPSGFPLYWRYCSPWPIRQRDGSLWPHLKPSSLFLTALQPRWV